jgi:hypothetical protein
MVLVSSRRAAATSIRFTLGLIGKIANNKNKN